jgi:hypothetical protein
MYKTKSIPVVALASVLCLAGAAAQSKDGSDSSVKDGSAAPIKIGALLPLSGGVELYGEHAKLGINLAAQEINSRGGILKHPLEMKTLGEIEPEISSDLRYVTSVPPLEVTFTIAGGHYNGAVAGGNLFCLIVKSCG